MTELEIRQVLGDINAEYQGTPFKVFHGYHGGRMWVQVGTHRPDTYTGLTSIGKGGKAYISEHATDDEIVKKIFGSCLAYVEHEAREGFKYRNRRIFGPHISLEALFEAAPKTTYRK